jgi:hypothetical protein
MRGVRLWKALLACCRGWQLAVHDLPRIAAAERRYVADEM